MDGMASDELDTRLNDFHRKLQDLQLTNARRAPKFLYHYSSQAGIEGILKHSVFWATDFRDLLDKKELHYGKEFVVCAIEERRRVNTNPDIERFLKAVLDRPHSQGWLESPVTLTEGFDNQTGKSITYDDYLDGFIACFCSEPASETQWQTYGDKGNGFAVGIDTHKLDWMKSPTPYYVDSVLYDPRRQKEKVDNYLTYFIHNAALLMLNLPKHRKDYVIRELHSLMSPYILWSMITFKEPSYYTENEWRVLYSQWRTKGRVPIHERSGRNGEKVRYIELHLDGTSKLPLRRLFYGPNLDGNQARDRLSELQRIHGYTGTAIMPWAEDVATD